MAANTQETMTKMFDSMDDNFKTTMSAFGRMQESWLKPFGEMAKTPSNVTPVNFAGMNFTPMGFENFAKSWVPFVEQNVENFTETCNATFGANLKAAKTAATATPAGADADFGKGSQKAFDATVTAFEANMDTLSKAFARNTENCTKLIQSVWSNTVTTKGCDSKGSDSKGSGKANNK